MSDKKGIENDDQVVHKLRAIDWYALTKTEAHGIGLSIGQFKDALMQLQHKKTTYRGTVRLTLIQIMLLAICWLFGWSLIIAIPGIFVAAIGSCCYEYFDMRETKKYVKTCRETLFEELEQLEITHPSTNANIDMLEALTFS